MDITRKQVFISSRFVWARILLVLSFVCGLASLSLLSYLVFSSASSQSTTATHSHRTMATLSAADKNAQAAHDVAQRYMTALIGQQYATMWSLLHPQLQAQWSDQQAFATYWKTRFQDYTLQKFTLGKASQRAYWVNPETMNRYDDVEVLPISLQLDWKTPPAQPENMAPQFLHPSQLFQNLPFVVQSVSHGDTRTAHWLVVAGGPADLEAPLLPPTTVSKIALTVPILMYHYISTVPKDDPNPYLRRDLSVAPTLFGQELDYLKAQGYHTITLNQLFDALYYNGPLPAKPIILSFDDGYEDAYSAAYPILKAHGYSGMFYLVTGEIGWPNHIKSWNNVREMVANGMQVGSHTPHHKDLRESLNISPAATQRVLADSQQTLQRQLGMPIQQFCYPAGQPFVSGTLVQRQEITNLLTQTGYIGATTTQWGSMQTSTLPFAMPRIRIRGTDTLTAFMGLFP